MERLEKDEFVISDTEYEYSTVLNGLDVPAVWTITVQSDHGMKPSTEV